MLDVRFNNVEIVIRANSAKEAYAKLDAMLHAETPVEMYRTDTFETFNVDDKNAKEWSPAEDTCELWDDEDLAKDEEVPHA